jgi:hypothetical protein
VSDHAPIENLRAQLARAAERIAAAGPLDTAMCTREEQVALILTYLGEWLADVAHGSLGRASLHPERPREWAFRSEVIALVGRHRDAGKTPVDDLLAPYFHRCGGTWAEFFDSVSHNSPDDGAGELSRRSR